MIQNYYFVLSRLSGGRGSASQSPAPPGQGRDTPLIGQKYGGHSGNELLVGTPVTTNDLAKKAMVWIFVFLKESKKNHC